MEGGPPVLAKRLWHIVRVLFYMLRKGISKNKLMAEMMKRGSIAGKKAIGHLMFHLHHTPSSSADRASYYVPREYEFSCSNTPAPSHNPFHIGKRKNHQYFSCIHPPHTDEDNIIAVQKALEMLTSDASAAVSPFLPGFGKSPPIRQLRITDSPFPIKDSGDGRVDQEAEDFINRFYEQLRQQKRQVEMDAMFREMILAGC